MSVKINGIEVEFTFKAEKAINEMKKLKKEMGNNFKGMTADLKKDENEQKNSLQRQLKLVRGYKKQVSDTLKQKDSTSNSKPTITLMGMTPDEYASKMKEASNKMTEATKSAQNQLSNAQKLDKFGYDPNKLKKSFTNFDSPKEAANPEDQLSRKTVKGRTMKLMNTAVMPNVEQPKFSLKGQVAMDKGKIVNTDQFKALQQLKIKLKELAPESAKARTALRNMRMSNNVAQQVRIASRALVSMRDKTNNATRSTKSTESTLHRVGSALGKVGNKAAASGGKLGRLGKFGSSIGSIAQRASRVGSALGKVGSKAAAFGSKLRSLGRFGSAMSGIGKGANGAGNAMTRAGHKVTSFGSRVAKLAQRVFIFTIITRALRGLREGLGGMLMTNSSFANSFNQIKVNLMTAFMPIYNAVLPAINALASGLAYATGVLASFMSSLAGTTYDASKASAQAMQKQTQAMKDQGEGADKTKEKVKKLQQQLAGFDTLNTITTSVEDSDSSSSDSKGVDFNKATGTYTTPKWLMDLKDDVVRIAQELWTPIQNAWDKVGGKLTKTWSGLGDTLLGTIGDIGRDFKDVWTNGTGEKTVQNILNLLESVGSFLDSIAKSFREAWNDNGAGEKLIQSYFDALNEVLELINTIVKTFETAWNKDNRGKKIFDDLLSTVKNVYDIAGNLASQFDKGWKKDNNGQKVADELLKSFNIVTEFFDELTGRTAEFAKNLDLAPIISAFGDAWSGVNDLLKPIKDLLIILWESAIQPIAKTLIEDGLPKVLELLGGAFSWIGSVLDLINPIISLFVDTFISNLVMWFKVLLTFLDPIIVAFNGIAEVFKKLKKGDFLGALLSWYKALFNFVKSILSIPIKIIKIIVGALVKRAQKIAEVVGGWYDKHLKKPLSKLVDSVVTWFKELPDKIVKKMGQLWDGIKGAFSIAGSAISEKVSGLWNWAGDVVQNILDGLGNVWESIKDVFEGFGISFSMPSVDNLKNNILGLLDGAKRLLGNALNFVGEIVQEVKRKGEELISKLGNVIGDVTQTAIRKGAEIVEKLGNIANTITQTVKQAGKAIVFKLNAVKNNITQTVKRTGKEVLKKIAAVSNTITQKVKKIGNVIKSIKNVAGNVVQNVSQKVSMAITNLKDMAGNIGTAIWDFVKKAINGFIRALKKIEFPFVGKPFGGLKELYAGTKNHRGGMARVNDQIGSRFREAYKLPGGQWQLFPNIRNYVANLPKGTQVLNAKETEQLFMPHYANGTSLAFPTLLTDLKRTMSPVSTGTFTAPQENNSTLANAIYQLIAKLERGEKVSSQDLRLVLNVDSLKLGEASVKGINRYHSTKGRMELII